MADRGRYSPDDEPRNDLDSRMVDVKDAKANDNAPPAQAPADDDAPKSFFSLANLKVAQVNIIGGALNGYSIGFVGVYANLYELSTNCSLYKTSESCTTLSNAKCTWTSDAAGDYCGWVNERTCYRAYNTEAACLADDDCKWNYSDEKCQNPTGYSSLYNGIFAGAMILGCMIGSFFSGPLAKKLGPKLSFILVGTVCIIFSVLYHISTAVDQFWVLCVARLIIGMALGVVCVAAPMYVAEHAAPRYAKMIGVLFQVFTTFGIFIAATIGLAVGQSVSYTANRNQELMARMQGICCFSTLLSVMVVVMGLFLGGFGFRDKKSSTGGGADENADNADANLKQYSFLQMLGPLAMGAVTAGTLQLTGINAVMNYAPTIMGSLGLDPLVGNFIVMVWNFVTTIFSIPLASVFSMRQLFLAGSIITSLMCLFMCGVPVYPGVTKQTSAKNGVAITGILLFIAAFEMGVGPCFFVLAQDLFPYTFRPKGSSVTMVFQFVFNVVINVFYPIATEKISGGPSGNQDKGQAIAFIFFGCIGLICFVLQFFFLFPWEEKDAGETADKAQSEGGNSD